MMLSLATLLWSGLIVSAWNPDGSMNYAVPRHCLPFELQKRFLENRGALGDQQDEFRRTLADCEAYWTRNSDSSQDIDAVWNQLDVSLPEVQDFSQRLPSGKAIKGWLAFQTDKSPHGFVIVECDWDCQDRTSPWMKALYASLYEEAGYHVLFLPTQLDSQLSIINSEHAAGGMARAMDLYDLGLWLQTEAPFRQRISSLHLFGIGWGGHSALFGLLYNDHNPIANDRKVFHGMMALCPITQAQDALNSLTPRQREERLQSILQIESQIPALHEVFSSTSGIESLTGEWLKSSWLQIQRSRRWLNPFRERTPESMNSFARANDFVQTSYGAQTPSWVLAPRESRNYEGQIKPLAERHRDPKKSQLSVYLTQSGSDCRYPLSHGWAVGSTLYKMFIQSQTFEIWPRWRWPTYSWSAPTPQLEEGEQHMFQRWLVDESGELSLEFHIWRGISCSATPWTSRHSCYREAIISVDWHQLPTAWQNRRSQVPTERLRRELNSRLRVIGPNGALTESTESAKRLEEVLSK